MIPFLGLLLVAGVYFTVFGAKLLFQKGYVERLREGIWNNSDGKLGYNYDKYGRGLRYLLTGLILLVFLFLSWHTLTEQRAQKRDFLIRYCEATTPGITIEKVATALASYYSEELEPADGKNRRRFGMSKSYFDTFCIAEYDSQGKVIHVGISYD